jgi:N-acetyl-anhydromuramyl-L-alanine amidase AmpD
MSDFVSSITQAQLPIDQYVNQVFEKKQIYLHHTAGNADPFAVIDWWKLSAERISTAFIIAGFPGKSTKWKDGEIVQCFSSKKAGWHLGLKAQHLVKGGWSSTNLNMKSIGIELTNWGWVTPTDKGFKTYAGNIIPDDRVIELEKPYRKYKYWETYTDAQIESTEKLLRYLGNTYDIPLKFKGMEMFEIDKRCLKGEAGIWTHGSCRPDKWDIYPHPKMIEMLRSL